MTTTARGPVFVVGYVVPTLGMERVLVDLLASFADESDVEAVALGGPELCVGTRQVRSLGPSRSGLGRLLTVGRLWRRRADLKDRTVVLVGVWTAVPFLMLGLHRRCRTIVWEHSLSSEKIETSGSLKLLSRLAGRLYPRAWRVVCVSQPLADDVRVLSPRARIVVIPNVIGSERMSEEEIVRAWQERRDRPIRSVATVGSLTSTKGQDRLVSALVDWEVDELVVVGDGPERERLERLATDEGVVDRVRFTGRVDHDEVQSVMARSDVLIHPAAGETFGMVLFEAAQLGLPVVAARHRVTEEFVGRYVPGVTYDESSETIPDAVARLQTVPVDEVGAAQQRRRSELEAPTIAASWTRLMSQRRRDDTR